jgi:uncharacterized membrane protein
MFVMILVDLPWLAFTKYVIKDKFYQDAGQMNLIAAAIVYVALAYLLQLQKSAEKAFYVGMATYAVYDFTLLAVGKNLSLTTAVGDTFWGGALFYITYKIIDFLQHEFY